MVSLINKTFDKLTVIALLGSDHAYNRVWICRCECGKFTVSTTTYLRRNVPHSCGCKHSPNKFKLRFSIRTCIVCGDKFEGANAFKFCRRDFCQIVRKLVLYLSNRESIKRAEYTQSGTIAHHYCKRCKKIATPNITLCPECLLLTAKEKASAKKS
jgi:hypothetical protein